MQEDQTNQAQQPDEKPEEQPQPVQKDATQERIEKIIRAELDRSDITGTERLTLSRLLDKIQPPSN